MLSCDKCRVSKKKCSRGQPCQRCKERGIECTYNAVTYNSEVVPKTSLMEDRLDKLEKMLKDYLHINHGIDVNLANIYLDKNPLKRPLTKQPTFDFNFFSTNIHSEKSISQHLYVNNGLSLDKLKLYFDTYVQTYHLSYPFINLKHLQLLFKLKPLDTPILYVIYCLGQLILLRRTKTNPLPSLQDNYFYQVAKYLLKTYNQHNSLLNVQSLILLADLELQHGLCDECGFHNIQAIRKLQMEGIDKPSNTKYTASSLMIQREREATWVMAKRVDGFLSSSTGIPYTVKFYREDWEKSADQYESYQVINSITKLDKNRLNITEDEFNQYGAFLIMELFSFSVSQLYTTSKFKTAVKQFDTLDKESFITESITLAKCLDMYPISTMDGTTFNEMYPTHNPHFNVHLTNYLINQFEAIGMHLMMIEYLNGAKEYNYPSPPSFDSNQDVCYYENLQKQRIQNLIQVLFPPDPKRRRYIDDLIHVDYIFVVPHFYIYKFNIPKYSQISYDVILNYFEAWPCLGRIFCMDGKEETLISLRIQNMFPQSPSSESIPELSEPSSQSPQSDPFLYSTDISLES